MNAIASVGLNFEIGKDNSLLFHIKDDMKRFRLLTLNKVVVMGRATFLSLPKSEPLKDRVNIVMTRNPEFRADGCIVVHSLKELRTVLEPFNTNDIFIIGGEEIYRELLPFCKKVYLTHVQKRFPEADRFFPNILNERWKAVSFEDDKIDVSTGLVYRYRTYVHI